MLPHEQTHAGPKEGRLRAPARDADAARADLPALRRRAARSSGPRGEPAMDVEEGGVRTRVWPLAGGRARARRAAPDRRRPPPLRDGRRLPRGGAVGDAHLRRPRLVALARARDLPDAPDRAGTSATFRAMTSTPGQRRHALPRRQLLPRARPTTSSTRARSSRSSPRASSTRRTPTRRSRRSTRRRGGRVPGRARTVEQVAALRRARGDDAAEVDVLLPEAHLGPALLHPAWREAHELP